MCHLNRIISLTVIANARKMMPAHVLHILVDPVIRLEKAYLHIHPSTIMKIRQQQEQSAAGGMSVKNKKQIENGARKNFMPSTHTHTKCNVRDLIGIYWWFQLTPATTAAHLIEVNHTLGPNDVTRPNMSFSFYRLIQTKANIQYRKTRTRNVRSLLSLSSSSSSFFIWTLVLCG